MSHTKFYQSFNELEAFKLRLGLSNISLEQEELLRLILEEAYMDVLDFCNRDELVGNMRGAVRDVAIVRWNRQGTEGETRRQEGDVTSTFGDNELPLHIQQRLKRYVFSKVKLL